ncbi:MAG: DEAD/DEAH box helicase [Candidatus Woesearchaeota archaeon]
MKLSEIKTKIPEFMYSQLDNKGMKELFPAQEKAVKQGLFDRKNLLICTPTASGKTLIAEFAAVNSIVNQIGKVIYIVPLKALASEKYNDFKQKYGNKLRIALSIGNTDSSDSYLENYDFIITTSEKLDSLLRHHTPWLKYVSTIIIDEVHLLNDPSRGPTLEILITMLKDILKNMQLISLSATIGNPKELARWLDAELIIDTWRPVELKQGIYLKKEIEYY